MLQGLLARQALLDQRGLQVRVRQGQRAVQAPLVPVDQQGREPQELQGRLDLAVQAVLQGLVLQGLQEPVVRQAQVDQQEQAVREQLEPLDQVALQALLLVVD